MGEIKPYWFIRYETSWNYGWSSGSGWYIVDAQTGELMLSLESVGGGITVFGPDYGMEVKPDIYLWWPDSLDMPGNFTDHALEAKIGEFTSVVLKLNAAPYYDASLPVSLKVTNVPIGFSVSQNTTSAILRTGGSLSYLLQMFTPVTYAVASVSSPQLSSQVPHIDVEISFIGNPWSYSIFVVQINK
jgi:hypothetical protein